MNKAEKKEVKEILAKETLSRADARILLRLLFEDSFFTLGLAIKEKPLWLKEQITGVKPFIKETQESILQESFKRLKPRPRIVLA